MKKYIFLDYGLEYDLRSRLQKIKDKGFDGVFLWYYDDENQLEETIAACNEFQLEIETIHLPFDACNQLWLEGEAGDQYTQLMIKGVKKAAEHGIPTVIMHTMSKKNAPLYNPLGLARIRQILDVCEQYQVNLAIENVRNIVYNHYVFFHLQSPRLKMCLDFGHLHCFGYTLDAQDFSYLRDKIICTHIHDNDGEDDQHLVLFYGNLPVREVITHLKEIDYQGPLTSEARILDPRFAWTEDDFLDAVFQSLEKLESMWVEQ